MGRVKKSRIYRTSNTLAVLEGCNLRGRLFDTWIFFHNHHHPLGGMFRWIWSFGPSLGQSIAVFRSERTKRLFRFRQFDKLWFRSRDKVGISDWWIFQLCCVCRPNERLFETVECATFVQSASKQCERGRGEDSS